MENTYDYLLGAIRAAGIEPDTMNADYARALREMDPFQQEATALLVAAAYQNGGQRA